MKCRNCKREIPDNSVFCNWCGERQIKEKKKEISVPKPTRRKSGLWIAQIMIDGKRTTVSAATEADYYAKARALKSGIIESAIPAPRKTLDVLVTDYIDSRSAVLSPSTIRGYRATWRSRFLSYHGKQAANIDYQRMVNAEVPLCSAKSLKNAWGLVSAALSAAGISVSVKLPTVPKADRPWLTPSEIATFLSAMRDQSGELPALLALHSLRKGEVLGLKWEDISGDIIHVHSVLVVGDNGITEKPTPKTPASDRLIKIVIPRLKELLAAVPEEERSGYLVKGSHQLPSRQIKRVCVRAGLPACTMHSLRHSYASLCHSLRIPILEVQRQGGWSDYETLRRIYTHLDELEALNAETSLESFYYQISTK